MVKMQSREGNLRQSATSPTANRLFTTAFVLVISANFANALGAYMATAILPVNVVSLGRSEFQAGLVTGVLSFTALLLRPIVGWLVDWRRSMDGSGDLCFIWFDRGRKKAPRTCFLNKKTARTAR
jgi:MFS family permease